jgi:hemin uptake protein HemP
VTEPAARAEPSTVEPLCVRLSSRELFGGRREIVILHGGYEYRLRITRADKLILTK